MPLLLQLVPLSTRHALRKDFFGYELKVFSVNLTLRLRTKDEVVFTHHDSDLYRSSTTCISEGHHYDKHAFESNRGDVYVDQSFQYCHGDRRRIARASKTMMPTGLFTSFVLFCFVLFCLMASVVVFYAERWYWWTVLGNRNNGWLHDRAHVGDLKSKGYFLLFETAPDNMPIIVLGPKRVEEARLKLVCLQYLRIPFLSSSVNKVFRWYIFGERIGSWSDFLLHRSLKVIFRQKNLPFTFLIACGPFSFFPFLSHFLFWLWTSPIDMKIIPIGVLEDNYSYILIDEKTKEAAVIDPVEPIKILNVISQTGAKLSR